MSGVDRRTFLGLMAAGAATAASGCTPETETDDPVADSRSDVPPRLWRGVQDPGGFSFPMGVASGDPLPDTTLVWTRYTGDEALQLSWCVWTPDGWGEVTQLEVAIADGGYVHQELADLPADTWVAYQFHDSSGASVVGRFVTPIDPDSTAPVSFGACSCLDQGHGAFPALTHAMGRGPVDAFFFLGDTAYFDRLTTREEFRALYARNLSASGFDDVLPRTSTIYTWDDHEFANNFDPVTFPAQRFDTALDSFLENLPIRQDAEERGRIWRSFRYGRTAEVFVLDCRTERDNRIGQYMSEAQLTWLIEGLQASTATWKLILNSVPAIHFTNPAWNIPTLAEDRWQAYPEQRQRLIDAVGALDGVMFVSGDVHCAIAGRLDPDGPGNRVWDMVVGPGGSFLNPAAGFLVDEQIAYGAGMHNAARIDLEHNGNATVRWIGEEDQTWSHIVIDPQGNLLEMDWTDPIGGGRNTLDT